jgi:hypothetical protein
MAESKITNARKQASAKYVRKPEVREARRAWNKQWIENNRERYNEAKSEYRFKLKLAAIAHYSGGANCCAQCGYAANIDALTLDHIEDNGAAHRKELGCSSRGSQAGTTMYERLKALGWLPGLQVLCANCNTIKAVNLRRGRDSACMHEAVKDAIRWRK